LDRQGRPTPSSILLAAQKRLDKLRAEYQTCLGSSNPSSDQRLITPNPLQAKKPIPRLNLLEPIINPAPRGHAALSLENLPDHLGWESAPLTATLRQENWRPCQVEERESARSRSWVPAMTKPTTREIHEPVVRRHIKLYPEIGLAILRQELAAPARIWLLLQHLDKMGRGWVTLYSAKSQLTQDGSPLRVCGWRQLRKLLDRGDSLFWRRDSERIWLRSTAKVAAALGVVHLTHRAVALPLKDLLKGIGMVRAQLYASFHSARSRGTGDKEKASPIARSTLQTLCKMSRQTQRNYERRVGVRQQSNYAIGRGAIVEDIQNRAWKHGRALFLFKDKNGRLGKPGTTYTAWQLPNNYFGPHDRQAKGRQKRINKELVDLFMKGMTGNDKFLVEDRIIEETRVNAISAFSKVKYQLAEKNCVDHFSDLGTRRRRFFSRSDQAIARYSRDPNHDVYWRSPRGRHSRFYLWYLLPGKKAEE